jgi:hypothetical protein
VRTSGSFHLEHNLVVSRRLGFPIVGPQAPGRQRFPPRRMTHRYERLVALEPDHLSRRRALSALAMAGSAGSTRGNYSCGSDRPFRRRMSRNGITKSSGTGPLPTNPRVMPAHVDGATLAERRLMVEARIAPERRHLNGGGRRAADSQPRPCSCLETRQEVARLGIVVQILADAMRALTGTRNRTQ